MASKNVLTLHSFWSYFSTKAEPYEVIKISKEGSEFSSTS